MIKQGIVLFLFALALTNIRSTEDEVILWNQFIYIGESIYNLKKLNDNGDSVANITLANGTLASVHFRLAYPAEISCTAGQKVDTFAYYTDDSGLCFPITLKYELGKSNFTEFHFNTTHSLQINYLTASPLFNFTINTTCIQTNETAYILTYTLPTDPTVSNITYIQINVQSNLVCPIASGIKSFWVYFERYKIIFAIVFFAIGLLLVFAGLKMFMVIMFLIGFISVTLLLCVLFMEFVLPSSAPQWGFWVMIGLSTIVGIIVGVICAKFYRVGVFILGMLFGAILGLILFSAFISRISQKDWVLGVTIGVLAIACGFVAWYANVIGVMISTSLIGSYMVIRASSWFIGGYPNEWTLASQIELNGWSKYWEFYIYMVVMLLLFAVGIVVQYKVYKSAEENKELEEKFKYFRIGGGNSDSKGYTGS